MGSPCIGIDEREPSVPVMDRSDLAAIQKGEELIRHGRFFKASRTQLIFGVLALTTEGDSRAESAFRSTDTPRLFSVRKMRPISARGFPCSTSTSHFRLVPAF